MPETAQGPPLTGAALFGCVGRVPPPRNAPGHANPPGGVRPRPTGNGNVAAGPFVTRPSPTGGLQAAPTTERELAMYNFWSELPQIFPAHPMMAILWGVLDFRWFVGRGQDPAAGTLRQARFSRQTTRFPAGRRGGVYAARGNGPAARNTPGHAKPNGGVKTPPYRERGGSTDRSW